MAPAKRGESGSLLSHLAVTTGRFGDYPRGGFLPWNVGTRTVFRRVENLPASLEAISLSKDSRIIATASQDNKAQLWDVASGRKLLDGRC